MSSTVKNGADCRVQFIVTLPMHRLRNPNRVRSRPIFDKISKKIFISVQSKQYLHTKLIVNYLISHNAEMNNK